MKRKTGWALLSASLLMTAVAFNFSALSKMFEPAQVNVIAPLRNSCPGIEWVSAADTLQRTGTLRVRGNVTLFGEPVPMQDPDVQERLMRELQVNAYWHSNSLLNFQYANRYFGEIEKLLKQEGLPDDFKYLALAESGLRDAVSPAGAIGYWQFLKETGRLYGLEVNEFVDERYNIEKSTVAAAKYFRDAKARFGNWTLAAASYNMGMAGLGERLRDQQVDNYYDLYLNQETYRYVFRILAMKIVFSNPEKAGYVLRDEDLYQPYNYYEVQVDTPITSVANFAAQFGLKYKHIKLLNPWLRDARMPNATRKTYSIRIMQPS